MDDAFESSGTAVKAGGPLMSPVLRTLASAGSDLPEGMMMPVEEVPILPDPAGDTGGVMVALRAPAGGGQQFVPLEPPDIEAPRSTAARAHHGRGRLKQRQKQRQKQQHATGESDMSETSENAEGGAHLPSGLPLPVGSVGPGVPNGGVDGSRGSPQRKKKTSDIDGGSGSDSSGGSGGSSSPSRVRRRGRPLSEEPENDDAPATGKGNKRRHAPPTPKHRVLSGAWGKLAAPERPVAAAANEEQGGKEEQGKDDCATSCSSRSSSEFTSESNEAGSSSDSPSAAAAVVVASPPPSPPPPPPPPPAAPLVPNEFAGDAADDNDDIPAASDLLREFDSNTTWAGASELSVAMRRTGGYSSLIDTSSALSQYPSSYRSTIAGSDTSSALSQYPSSYRSTTAGSDTSSALSQYPSSYRSTTAVKLDNAGVWSEESQGKNGGLNFVSVTGANRRSRGRASPPHNLRVIGGTPARRGVRKAKPDNNNSNNNNNSGGGGSSGAGGGGTRVNGNMSDSRGDSSINSGRPQTLARPTSTPRRAAMSPHGAAMDAAIRILEERGARLGIVREEKEGDGAAACAAVAAAAAYSSERAREAAYATQIAAPAMTSQEQRRQRTRAWAKSRAGGTSHMIRTGAMPNLDKVPPPRGHRGERRSSGNNRRGSNEDQQHRSSGCSRRKKAHHQPANDGHDISSSEEADIGNARYVSATHLRSRRSASSSASRFPPRPQEEVESLANKLSRADDGSGNVPETFRLFCSGGPDVVDGVDEADLSEGGLLRSLAASRNAFDDDEPNNAELSASQSTAAATWERSRVESARNEAASAIDEKEKQQHQHQHQHQHPEDSSESSEEKDSSESSDTLSEEDDEEEEEEKEDDNDGSTMRRQSSDDYNNYNAETLIAECATTVPREKEGQQQASVTFRGKSDGGEDGDRGDEYDSSAPPPHRPFAKESDDGEAHSVKDVDDSVDGGYGPSEDGSGLSIDSREDAAKRRRKDVFPVSNLKHAPSYDGAVERSILLKQNRFVSGAVEGKGCRPPPSPRVSFALDDTCAVAVTQSRAGKAGGADTRAGDGALPEGRSRQMNSRSTTGGSVGEEFSRSDRESSSGGSGIASAMLEAATELAQNCSIPFVSEAATLMSQIVKLVSDNQDNTRGIEKRLARCRSIISLLENAAKVVGKGDNFNGEAECHAFVDVQDAIADLVDLIKTYRSKNRVSKVLTSSVFKRREEEANVAIDRAIVRSNFGLLTHHVGAERPGPLSSRHQAESASASAAASRRSRRQRKLNQIEIPEDEVLISSDELLGRGGFGAVHIGDFLGRSVACKVLQIKHGVVEGYDADTDEPRKLTESEKKLRKTCLREVDAMIRLRSPHTVHVYGQITSSQHGLVLVMELLVGGDLRMLLKSSDQPLPEEQSRRIIGDICAGMTFLHRKETIHGDLKSANVLLDGDGRAKIGDFGTAKWTHHTNSTGLATYSTEVGQNNHKFSLAWSAPEVLDSKGSTYASDVYSFGVIVWEVITTKRPWADKTPLQIMCAVLGGQRPEFAADTPTVMADVARRCWTGKADERPTFRAIMEELKILFA